MTKQTYPTPRNEEPQELASVLRQIARLREQDVRDFNNLSKTFILGRKVDKIPSSSSDVTGSRPGDINYDASYLYICLDNAGTAVWRRVAISSF